MKLYYFEFDDYGEEAVVGAESREEAEQALLDAATRLDREQPVLGLKDYHTALARRMTAEVDGYSLRVIEPGTVIWTERS